MLLAHAGGVAGVTHLPAIQDLARFVRTAMTWSVQGSRAVIALGAQPMGIGALGLGVVAVMAVHQGEPALAQQYRQFVLTVEQQPPHAMRVGQHMRLAGQRQGPPALAQVPAQRDLAHAERHAIMGGAVAGERSGPCRSSSARGRKCRDCT